MAAIDKIYVESYEQYLQFKEWCEQQPPLTDKYGKEVRITDYMYRYQEFTDQKGRPVFNAPYYVDAYVIRNCPLDFIQKELMVNYGHWSQEKIDEAYDIVTNRTKENEMFYSWLNEDDFKVVDGVVTMPKLEKSDYQKIKDGEMYVSPSVEREYGRHLRCTKHPVRKYNTPFRARCYDVSIDLPEDCGRLYMWYHYSHNSWDYPDEFVSCDWSSSHAHVRTIKALKRRIRKWKLPVGTTVTARGRYIFDDYEFLVTK